MVETRRTSRRLQAKATASPTPSPMSSPAGRAPVRRSRRTPSPRSRAKKQVEVESSDESAQEISITSDEDKGQQEKKKEEVVVIDSETESESIQAKKQEQQVVVIDSESEEKEAEQEQTEASMEKPEAEEEEEEEIMLLDDDDDEEESEEEKEDEEDDDDEDIDQYAFLAASGLNLSTKSSAPSSAASTQPAAAKPSPAEVLKRRLVPNQLNSGASQYKEFFDFDGSRRAQAATLRSDTRATEEAKILTASQKAVAHSERQRTESQHKKSAGRRWFNFESDEMTDDARRDFALLRMRNYLDPKKFYKSSDHSRALPKHFQMGVVIEGAHEFHSARLTKKQRRKTFTDEIMADEAVVQYTHRVAGNIQKARSNQGHKKRRRN
ncbi:hypothetical protein V7S43_009727 [Phytophthora oleae]|uniref:Fcf2 pre-rRNA processing C-terminal domain-containing protein n=1 Tax=Phytophthora oleae TaxID=2107226 RepID=A0ABD3FHS6_9STRA